MRPSFGLRAPTVIGAAGAAGFVTTLVAVASAASGSDTPGAPPSVHMRVADHTVRYGHRVVAHGHVGSRERGAPVALQLRVAHTGTWRTVDRGHSGARGRFRLGGRTHRSGAVRVLGAARGTTASIAALRSSPVRHVRVRAKVVTHGLRRHIDAGERLKVHGRVLPHRRHRVVRLQLHRGHGWHTVDRARTGRHGGFGVHERLGTATTTRARIRVSGTRQSASAHRRLGRVAAFRPAVASWYGPGLYGNALGCGGTLEPSTIGVANKTLPCGTRLTLRYHGNTVHARVIDRGPYVAGREFDLTAATKAALGFGSTGVIGVSVS